MTLDTRYAAASNGVPDSGWTEVGSGGGAPAFTNSWVNGGGYANVRYRKIGSVVHLDGYALTGSGGTSVFTLPAGYRPSHNTYVAVVSGTPGGSYVLIGTDGTVKPAVGGGTGSLLTCCFLAA